MCMAIEILFVHVRLLKIIVKAGRMSSWTKDCESLLKDCEFNKDCENSPLIK